MDSGRHGDQVALDALVGRHLPLLYNIVGRALDGNQDVDDVVQETPFRVVDRLRDLRDPAAFRSWMVAIAMRQAAPLGHGPDATAQLDTADPGADFVDLTILRLALTDQRRETAPRPLPRRPRRIRSAARPRSSPPRSRALRRRRSPTPPAAAGP
ncbi:MAG TPA: sigma-70 family RNA polymerase sigma factor [Actinospica sp.]|nr:sigma-70 family RNA polymerase sigma factor [Actinospica sp.]